MIYIIFECLKNQVFSPINQTRPKWMAKISSLDLWLWAHKFSIWSSNHD